MDVFKFIVTVTTHEARSSKGYYASSPSSRLSSSWCTVLLVEFYAVNEDTGATDIAQKVGVLPSGFTGSI